MDKVKQRFERRWRKLEAAKSHTRKVAFAVMGLALTSLVLAISSVAG